MSTTLCEVCRILFQLETGEKIVKDDSLWHFAVEMNTEKGLLVETDRFCQLQIYCINWK